MGNPLSRRNATRSTAYHGCTRPARFRYGANRRMPAATIVVAAPQCTEPDAEAQGAPHLQHLSVADSQLLPVRDAAFFLGGPYTHATPSPGPSLVPTTLGVNTFPAATQDNLHRRLFRCGLAATQDHAVRLGLTAQHVPISSSSSTSIIPQQAQQHPSFKPALGQTGVATQHILHTGVVPHLQPPPAASAASSASALTCDLSSMVISSGSSGGRGGAGGCGDEGDNRRQHHTNQLGLLYTLAKEAACVARELDVGSGAAGAVGQLGGQEAGRLLERAKDVLGHLFLTMGRVQWDVWRAGETHGTEEGAASRGEEGRKEGGEEAALGWDAECVDEVHEALALAAVRAASNLAAPLAWQLAADLAAGAAAGGEDVHARGQAVIRDALCCVAQGWRGPLLPPAQLLACQPHRLVATTCSLVAVLPPDPLQSKRLLSVRVAVMVIRMASHGTLSVQVRSWLAPPPAAAAAAATTSSKSQSSTCGGCLAAALQSAVRHTTSLKVPYTAALLALLKIASGEAKAGVPCCAGGRDATGGGGWELPAVRCGHGGSSWGSIREPKWWSPAALAEVLLPDGSRTMDLLVKELGAGSRPLAPLMRALPPPLALSLRRRGQPLWLHVCGNPRCSNFAGECEGALPLRRCGGCRVVRYCGAECQRAHWAEGHRAECKALAANAGDG